MDERGLEPVVERDGERMIVWTRGRVDVTRPPTHWNRGAYVHWIRGLDGSMVRCPKGSKTPRAPRRGGRARLPQWASEPRRTGRLAALSAAAARNQVAREPWSLGDRVGWTGGCNGWMIRGCEERGGHGGIGSPVEGRDPSPPPKFLVFHYPNGRTHRLRNQRGTP
jgi:hypothetical protein